MSFKHYYEIDDLDKIKEFVENGADIHADNNRSLYWSAGKGYLDVVKYLIKEGADIHADNNIALRWSAKNGHLDVVKYLIEEGADYLIDNGAFDIPLSYELYMYYHKNKSIS